VRADDTCIESGSILTAVDIIHEQNQRGITREIFMANLWQENSCRAANRHAMMPHILV
jgi:hypothetical protein